MSLIIRVDSTILAILHGILANNDLTVHRMMKKLTFSLLFLGCTLISIGQSKFTDVQHDTRALEMTEASTIFPASKRIFKVDFEALSDQLASSAPDEFSGKKGLVMSLPLPTGDESFEFFYSPVVEPGLQEEYPHIRSYKAYGVEDRSKVARITISQLGLKASVRTADGEIYIDPFIEGQTEFHAAYNVNDFDPMLIHEAMPSCGNEGIFDASPIEHLHEHEEDHQHNGLRSAGEPIQLRTFRTAIATTGEWSLAEGGKDNAVAKVISCVDRGNQIFENEVGFRLVLVANNASIVYDDPTLDPYTGSEPKSGRDLIGMNTTVLNSRIGQGNYDIGHVFTNRCSDVGGVASLASVCGGNKGSGTTCWYNRNLDYTVIRIMCHEMGHQFSGPHTFNNCGGNESGATAYEPGSGSTIMSYGGLCGSNDVVSGTSASRDITYYHANSLMRLFTFSRFVGCGGQIQTNNTRPDAVMNYQDGFYIPISTPFVLNGEAIDEENDNVTYCFEQHNFSAKRCPLGQPEDDCPMFRSFPPNSNPYRVFPSFSIVWNNQIASSANEVLPDYNRELDFVLTVRDNNPEVGAFGMDTVNFNSTVKAGPFLVSYPDNGEDQIADTYVEITWDVAGTDQDPVNCQFVDILFYNGAGWDNYEVLKLSTANDGTEWVRMPANTSSNNKIMVRAADNIFFDISNRTFSVVEPSVPGFSFGVSPNSARVCLPEIFSTEILASAFGGYTGQLELDVVSGLPANATFSFDKSVIDASENTILNIDLTNVTDDDDTVIEIQAVNEFGDTLIREVYLDIVRSDFSALEAVFPADGMQGIEQSPTLEWPLIEDADYYNVEIATSPSFETGTIISEWENLTTNSIALPVLLDKNTIYYWRVQAGNVCNLSDPIIAAAFSTEAASCAVYESPDRNVFIQSNTTREFGINLFVNADVNDVNIGHIDFFCDFLQDAKLTLISPSQTEVVLFDQRCGNTTTIDCTFDDDAPSDIKCPPIDQKPYRPEGSLASFNNEPSQGKWTLKVEVSQNAASAKLNSWDLEVCSNTILDAPIIVNNDTMKTRPQENNPIINALLLAEDNNNDADELEFTLTTIPYRGVVYFNGNPLQPGMTFTQADLNSGQIRYENVDGQEGMDDFYFTVNDGEGGWTGTHKFVIALDNDFASDVNDHRQDGWFKVFPNPNNGDFTIYFDQPTKSEIELTIRDAAGHLLSSRSMKAGQQLFNFDLTDVPQGIYLLKATSGNVYLTERIVISE